MIRASLKTLAQFYQTDLIDPFFSNEELDRGDRRMLPGSMGPVLRKKGEKRFIESMRFSMIPSWSKEKKLKFATHNARLEGIEDKPTWKKPFLTRHCVVPISFFVEPSYKGPLAGNMLQFEDSGHGLLHAAAIWDEWVDQKTGEVIHSFAILTRDPSALILEHGHDRTPVFLGADQLDHWLEADPTKNAKDWTDFLGAHATHPSLDVRIDRPLKSKKKA